MQDSSRVQILHPLSYLPRIVEDGGCGNSVMEVRPQTALSLFEVHSAHRTVMVVVVELDDIAVVECFQEFSLFG